MIEFVNYTEEFLELSWNWLNDVEIKEMTMTPNFSKEDQKKWFLNLKKNKSYYIKGVVYNGTPIGVVGLKNIEKNQAEYWGYIGIKKYWGMGIGKLMLSYIEDYSKNINIKTLFLKVSYQNVRAFKLYTNFKYKEYKKQDILIILKKEFEEG